MQIFAHQKTPLPRPTGAMVEQGLDRSEAASMILSGHCRRLSSCLWSLPPKRGCSSDLITNSLECFWIVDANGTLRDDDESIPSPGRIFARSDETAGMPLLETIKKVKPTVVLGLTACTGLFNDDVLTSIAQGCERPIIFPLSNPTASAECTAEAAYRATNGRAIVASGSPFDPVMLNGTKYTPAQCNNMFIFPGLGLGATVGKCSKVSLHSFLDRMYWR